MTRAKIPQGANILVPADATTYPSEVGFDPFEPFKILWVITNGTIQRNFLWVTIRKSGIYVAFGGPDHMHTSYHSDGSFQWKIDRKIDQAKIPMGNQPPLPEIPRPIQIQSAAAVITNETLDKFDLTRFDDQPVDKVVYLDNRMLPESITYEVWAVPPFKHNIVPLITEYPAHIHIITHTNPWLQVIIYESGRR